MQQQEQEQQPPSSDASVTCRPGTDYLPSPTDCGSYFRCVDGNAFRQNCASGLHWAEEKNSCDWPANAGCRASTRYLFL